MMQVTRFVTLLREATVEWWKDDVPRMAAAIAFYTLFSFAPLVVVVIMVAGVVFGEEAAAGQLAERLETIVGRAAGEAIEAALASANRPKSGVFATIVSVLISAFAATGVFHELGKAFDRVWEHEPAPANTPAAADPFAFSYLMLLKRSMLELMKARFWAFTMVLGFGLCLLLSLLSNTMLESLARQADSILAGWIWPGRVVDTLLSLSLATLVFAMIYKALPTSQIAWRDVWLGAGVAAILFSISRVLAGAYLAHSGLASVYGAAGALVVFMIWTWFSAMVLLFGAEVCEVYAREQGRMIGRIRIGRLDALRARGLQPAAE